MSMPIMSICLTILAMSAPPLDVPKIVPPSKWIPSTLDLVSTIGGASLS